VSKTDPARGGRTSHPACAPAGQVRFAHPSERLFAALLDLSGERWEYEPVEFPLEWDAHGSPVSGFRPDFYLPSRGVFIELTTADQRLVTRKNRKVRRMRELYPEVQIRVVYQRDFASLLASHGLPFVTAGAA
jgi:hypothetical protein